MKTARKDKVPAPSAPNGPVWGRRISGEAGKANVAYCAGWDVRKREAADLELLPYDLWTNRAHCTMLARVGVIPPVKFRRIARSLDKLEALAQAGEFELRPELEDVHLNVESFVEAAEGVETAGMMHTARSRNDQVATDMRLYLRDRVLEFSGRVMELSNTLLRMSGAHLKTLMPGLTHHQPAAWTTLAHWAVAHASAFARDALTLLDLHEMLNVCPLGAAASFGTSWPINRELTTKYLGFDAVQENTLDCVTNRSEFEARVAGAVAMWAAHAATLSQDLIMFTSPPWQLMRLGDAYVTGSSIMPQKRNPDFAEVTKAKASLAGSIAANLLDLTRGDPSGYNREQQWSKYLTLDLFAELGDAPLVIGGALESLTFDKSRMRWLMENDYLEAADVADYLAQTREVPFRMAYRWLGEAVRVSEEGQMTLAEALTPILASEDGMSPLTAEEQANLASPDFLLGRRASQGGPSPDSVRIQIQILQKELSVLSKRRGSYLSKIQRSLKSLQEAMEKIG